jgi:hypothetical protein
VLTLEALRSMKPMLATPMGFGAQPVYTSALFKLGWTLGQLGVATRYEIGGESAITRIRARLVARFLESDCDHFLFWDADVGVTPEAVLRLLLADKDVVCGVYPLKAYPLRYPVKALDGILRPDLEGFAEVLEATTGMMCIRRCVFEQMAEAYPELNYIPEDEPHRQPSHWLFFDNLLHDRRYLTEDYAFCHRWRAIGGKVHIDIHSKLDHQGTHIFHGDLMDHLRQQSRADGLPQAAE